MITPAAFRAASVALWSGVGGYPGTTTGLPWRPYARQMGHAEEPAGSRPPGRVRRMLAVGRRGGGALVRAPRRAIGSVTTAGVGYLSRPPTRPGIHGWIDRPKTQLAGVIALASLPITVAEATGKLEIPYVLAVVFGIWCVVPIVLLAWRPFVAWGVATLVTGMLGSTYPITDSAPWPWPVTYGLVSLLTLVAVSITSRLAATVLATALTCFLFGALSAIGTQVGWAVGVGLFALGGVLIRWRTLVSRQLERHEELTEVEKARRTVLEERARIARDLHDVVAHRMSLVVVAAETAPYRISDVSPAMRAELDSIGTTAREALAELRGLLGVLRSAAETPAYAPQPVLADVGHLVDGANRAGLQVRLEVVGARRPVGGAVELSGYRIVQESLANAARHAPGARVDVLVAYEPQALRVEIVNEPPVIAGSAQATNGAGRPTAAGHGLTGMSERAAVVGGWVHAAPTPDGGFRVIAMLPPNEEMPS